MKIAFFSYVKLYILVQVTNFLKEFALTVFKVEYPFHTDDEGSSFLQNGSLIYKRTQNHILEDYHFHRSRLYSLKPNLIFVSPIVTHTFRKSLASKRLMKVPRILNRTVCFGAHIRIRDSRSQNKRANHY